MTATTAAPAKQEPSLTKQRSETSELATAPSGKTLVVARRCGRLANRLVLFANFIAMAEEQGHRLFNFTFHSYAKSFKATKRDVYCRFPITDKRSLFDRIPGVADLIRNSRIFYHTTRTASDLQRRLPIFDRWSTTLLPTPGLEVTDLDSAEVQSKIRDARLIFIDGWPFRAEQWVQRHAETIRHYFHPIDEVEKPATTAVEKLRQEADIVVGVHIRHGDYRTWKNGINFHEVDQYARWMHELAEQYPNQKVAFHVCSDEPRSSQEFPGLTVGLGAGPPVTDLYTLAKCDLVFGPISTFSQWASFYGNTPLRHITKANTRLETQDFSVSFLREIP